LQLRLRSHLIVRWRGERWVRGRIYEAANHADYLEMMGSGYFAPAEAAASWSPAEIAAALATRLEIVAVRNAGLGDTLIALPYVQEFARTNPRVDVSYAVHPAYVELISEQPGLHAVYDVCGGRPFPREIDLCHYAERHRGSRSRPRDLLFGEAFGINRRVLPGLLNLTALWGSPARAALKEAGHTPGQPIAALTARGTCNRRSYAEPLVREVAEHLAAAGVFVALTDLDADARTQSSANSVSAGFRDRLTVAQLAGLLSLADIVIGPDTGVLHLGAHLGKPLVGIFTDWPARLRLAPYNAFAFQPRDLPCFPCHDRGCPPLTCTTTAEPREVAAAAIACLAPKWRLRAPEGGEGFRNHVAIFGAPLTRG
jgi:hypothetical protein